MDMQPTSAGTSLHAARQSRSAHGFAKGLGWFSLGIGLAELLAPKAMARAIGLEGREDVIRAYGLREIAAGIGILNSDHPAPWLWARAGGDALDLATLGVQVPKSNGSLEMVSAAMAAVAGVAVLDVACARALSQEDERRQAHVDDYRQRSGFPKPPDQMRGAARSDFQMPADMQAPEALRPFGTEGGPG
ncbi:MAG TPA: hypothetical protein VFF03_20080 [Rhodocyclaceae bacterium]|nr:hypothetical protein [Rhodocyclaceae bacterium]